MALAQSQERHHTYIDIVREEHGIDLDGKESDELFSNALESLEAV